MTYQDIYQQNSWQNPMQWSSNPYQTAGMNSGLGQAAYGMGQQAGAWGQPWQQRQLSPFDVSEVVRQMVPLLPQILAQSQQPQAAYGFGYGINQRQLSPQDVNEVVRQLLPILPQILGAIQQGQTPVHAIHGGFGQQGIGQGQGWQNQGWQNPYAQHAQYGLGQGFGNSYGQFGPQAQFGQFGSPFQAAFGGGQNFGQRQLSPQDVNEVLRQLVTTIPQVIGNLQAHGQRLN